MLLPGPSKPRRDPRERLVRLPGFGGRSKTPLRRVPAVELRFSVHQTAALPLADPPESLNSQQSTINLFVDNRDITRILTSQPGSIRVQKRGRNPPNLNRSKTCSLSQTS